MRAGQACVVWFGRLAARLVLIDRLHACCQRRLRPFHPSSPSSFSPHLAPVLDATSSSCCRLAERLEAQGCSEPEICVMAGGWKRFRRELEMEDFDLVRRGVHCWGCKLLA